MTFAKLRALHTVIGQALDEIEQVYKANSPDGAPLDYPSLDVPYYSSLKHAPEVEKAEALRIEATVFAASNRIVAAAGQLSATVNKPWFTLIESINAVRGGDIADAMGTDGYMRFPDQLCRMSAVPGGEQHRRDPARGGAGWIACQGDHQEGRGIARQE